MAYRPIGLAGKWGLDCDFRLTPAIIRAVCAVDLSTVWPEVCPQGTFAEFFERYIPLPSNGIGQDVTPQERDDIAGENKILVLVQHVRGLAPWTATPTQGDLDAQYALQYADQLGYSVYYDSDYTGSIIVPAITQDMENLKMGSDSYGSASAFRDRIQSRGSVRHCVYEGFNCLMTGTQLAQLGVPLQSDYGNRTPPPNRGFALHQHQTRKVAGYEFDLDQGLTDLAGEQLYGMGNVPDVAA